MRHTPLILLALAVTLTIPLRMQAQLPAQVQVDGGQFHVQGLAFDKQEECFYLSFTSAFVKADINGKIIGSITGINGHLGAMTFDPVSRKVFASLELKDDAIGRNISEKLGAESWTRDRSAFYVAEIDVDKVISQGMRQDETMRLYLISEACDDYKAFVSTGDTTLSHRFACSGIDGITIAPAIGEYGDSRCLYVAYGIYGDVNRNDNDYNVLLCYPLDDIGKLEHKYFIHTGNTTWGIQNLAYDSASGRILMAVYHGKKPRYPNYDLFSVDTGQKPFRAPLEGVPYFTGDVEQLALSHEGLNDPATGIWGWRFEWGSTGLCPLGDGTFYISVNGSEDGNQYCRATLYRWTGNAEQPFERIIP